MSAFVESVQTAIALILHADPALSRTVALSLTVSGAATALAALFALVAGAWLAVAHFPGHRVLVLLLNTLLALPSVAVGLLVYLLLSRAGPLGSWGLLFTPSVVVASRIWPLWSANLGYSPDPGFRGKRAWACGPQTLEQVVELGASWLAAFLHRKAPQPQKKQSDKISQRRSMPIHLFDSARNDSRTNVETAAKRRQDQLRTTLAWRRY